MVQDGLVPGTLDDILFIVHIVNDSLGGACLLFRVYFTVKTVYVDSYDVSACIPSIFISQERQGCMHAFG